jgi:hypothetical protein
MPKRITEVAPADADRVVELVCLEIDNVADRITAEASWERLAEFFYQQMLHNKTLSTATVLAWAEAGHPAADRAVRRYAAEMIDTGRKAELLLQVDATL